MMPELIKMQVIITGNYYADPGNYQTDNEYLMAEQDKERAINGDIAQLVSSLRKMDVKIAPIGKTWQKELQIMNKNHPQWQEFLDRLEGEEGCNFRKDKDGKTIWTCSGGNSKEFAKKILDSIGGVDIDATFAYFERRGGYCDCEILFNVPD